jgi:RimJ/RimL family protein N-acetyltransferase
MNHNIFFYCVDNNDKRNILSSNYNFFLYHPSFFDRPKGLSITKFLLWNLFRLAGIFKSNFFSINLLYLDGKLVHHTYVFPKFFRFPFMNDLDIQLGDIWTDSNFSKRGIAFESVSSLISMHPEKKIWYLCEVSNLASVQLASKCGFTLVGKGYKMKSSFNLFSKYIIETKI